jgi:hypothetical protein
MNQTPHKSPQSIAACAPEALQTGAFSTCKHPIAYQNRLSPAGILGWLERHGYELLIQRIRPGKRLKNRVVVQYHDLAGSVQAVGGVNIAQAVLKAQLRLNAKGDRN